MTGLDAPVRTLPPPKRVLLVRLRSIGDTVLMTPVLEALKSWSPAVSLTVVTEPLSAPVLEAHPLIDKLLVVHRTRRFWSDTLARARLIWELRQDRYDWAVNLHGGTTAAWLCRLSGAPRRIGYGLPNTRFLLTDSPVSPQEVWQKAEIHCVEQQLGLLKACGVPLSDTPALSLQVTLAAQHNLARRLAQEGITRPFAVIHPAAAFASKQWQAEGFGQVVTDLHHRGLHPVVMVAPFEAEVGRAVRKAVPSSIACTVWHDLPLAEVMALISTAALFVGNDSGPAHLAAGFGVPLVVIFGSSNETVWHPWTTAPFRVVRKKLPCVPCAGYTCHAFPEPECIKRVTTDEVLLAIDAVWRESRPESAIPF
ncbi:MAG: glycosyltransferase family 9 protein [Blastocatellia bacterium]|nr:glycosyltransferase family 9 protein [Blastocatellia bacterium]